MESSGFCTKLYKLADILFLRLKADKEDLVSGGNSLDINVKDLHLEFTIDPRVDSSFHTPHDGCIGLLVHIVGDVTLFAYHNYTKKMFIVDIIDKSKVDYYAKDYFLSNDIESYAEAVKQLKNGRVASFMRTEKQEKWTPVPI